MIAFAELSYADMSRYRFAEEREWMASALFYQRRQWLSWDDGKRRWSVQKPDPKKPRPQPVSNYFAKTINANANALGAELPKMLATATDDDPGNRRGADMAEKAKDAIDKESGIKFLNPLLAKHVPLWGIGVTKDIFDTSLTNGVVKVPVVNIKSTTMIGCADCGGSYDVGPVSPIDNGDGTQSYPQMPCPQCGSNTTVPYPDLTADIQEVEQFSKGKITTEVIPIFEVFLPRDCQNPNMAKRVLQRSRKSTGTLRRMFPLHADDIQADEQVDIHDYYYQALKSLVNYNYLQDQSHECATYTEMWADWDELPEELQEDLTDALQSNHQALEMLQLAGLYMMYITGTMLDWGINPYYERQTSRRYFPYTFFLWELDPANTYNKGLASDLTPLQKRLNRIDSLIELGMMSNAAGKWLWPKTQTTRPPTGSPNDVVEFDPVGEGKIPPSFVQPSPFHPAVWQLRQTILADFNALGLTEAVSQGQTPGGGANAFRAIAYLGAKAAEQISTQRYLWESAHQLRYEKCLLMAQMFWDEPRKIRVAGPNGKFQAESLTKEDLRGSYEIEFVPNSSRPKTVDEKASALQMLLQGGMVDPTDPATREYVLDMCGLDNLNLTDHLQYTKAERDLDHVQHGETPVFSPYAKWDVFLKVFANYTLTEEYEQQQPDVQQRILQMTEYFNQQMTLVKMAAMPPPGASGPGGPGGPPSPGDQLAHALQQAHNPTPGAQLQRVPGQGTPAEGSENGAVTEGNAFAAQMP